MPISIPMMQRRKSAADLGATEAAAAVRGASTFVPPHMLPRGDDEEGGQPPMEAGVSLGLGLSPSAGGKREKLLARNAILRSTGFIEVQQPVAAVIGERGAWCRLALAGAVEMAPGGWKEGRKAGRATQGGTHTLFCSAAPHAAPPCLLTCLPQGDGFLRELWQQHSRLCAPLPLQARCWTLSRISCWPAPRPCQCQGCGLTPGTRRARPSPSCWEAPSERKR